LRGLGLLAPALLLLPGVTSAEDATSVGTVTRVSGHVIVSRGTSNEMSTLKFKDSLFDHDRIGTGETSSARFLLGGKALVTVRQLSSRTIAEQPDRAGLRLTGGTVALAVAEQRMRPDENVDIHLPNAVASARGAVLIAEATRATDPAVGHSRSLGARRGNHRERHAVAHPTSERHRHGWQDGPDHDPHGPRARAPRRQHPA